MRKFRVALLRVARAMGMFQVSRLMTANGVRILCYHGAWLANDRFPGDAMFIRPQTFADRMAMLRRLGYPVIPLAEAVEGLEGRRPLPANAVVITIDDGWYSTFSAMRPVLEAHRLPATLYCNTAELLRGQSVANVMVLYVHILAGSPSLEGQAQVALQAATNPAATPAARQQALQDFAGLVGIDLAPLIERRAFSYMTPAELHALFAGGLIDVQLHTHNHTLHDQSEFAVRREIAENVEALTRLLDAKPAHFKHFCYPSGLNSESAARTLDEIGIASSTVCEPGLAYAGTPRQLLPRFLDGDNYHPVEIEAELSGLYHLVRTALARIRAVRKSLTLAVSGSSIQSQPNSR